MALDYGALKTQVLEDAHRPQLTTKIDDFIRQAEGFIYRRLRAAEMITRVDLTDSDRVTADEGFYTLPSDFLEWRALFLQGSPARELEPVSLAELRTLPATAQPRYFTVISKSEIEFRGVPSTTAEIELIYFARPAALSSDSDTNDILTNHEGIYIAAALAEVYRYSQDLELAQLEAQAAVEMIEKLNEQAGRVLGGARTHGYYCLSSFGGR